MRTHSGVGLAALVLLSGGCLQILGYKDTTVIEPGTGGGGGTAAATTSSATTSTATGGGVCMPDGSKPCYDGPTGTEGKGSCQAGNMTCNAEGTAYGACVGAITPKMENCAAPADENCDGAAPSCKGDLAWAKRFGDMDQQVGKGVAVDSMGNVLITGAFAAGLDFGNGPLNSAGSGDVFVAKLDTSGFLSWGENFGDMASQGATSVAVDSTDSVIVAGSFAGSLDFGGGALVSGGKADIFVAKLDVTGKQIWSKRFACSDDASVVKLAVDSANNVLVWGNFGGFVDFGGGAVPTVGGGDLFLTKLDAAGTPLWSKTFGDKEEQFGADMTVDSAGNVVVTGTFTSTLDFGGGALVASGTDNDIFVAKLDVKGDQVWSKRFGDMNDQFGAGVAVDGADDVLLTGSFTGSVNFGGKTIDAVDVGTDIFVAKFDASGKALWSEAFGSAGDQDGKSIVVDRVGNVLVAGSFTGTVNFGGGPLAVAAGTFMNTFLVKLDANGGHQWSKRFGDVGYVAEASVAVSASNDVVIAGYFAGAVNFGLDPFVSEGGNDVFVAKFSE
jgi:hypothetical protein